MTFVFVLVALAVITLVAVLAVGKLGQLSDPVRDRYQPEPPQVPVSADDAEGLRFGITARGYRMDEVDEMVNRLAETIRIREAQIAALSEPDPNPRVSGVTTAISASETPETRGFAGGDGAS